MAIVSLRAYARHRGVSLKAVQKAIESGRITKTPDGKINPEQADAEWARNTAPHQRTVKPAVQRPSVQVPRPAAEIPLRSDVSGGALDYVPRDTRHYADVAQWLHRRSLLSSETLRWLALDILFTAAPQYLNDSELGAIVRYEKNALDQFDIPSFSVKVDSHTLNAGSAVLPEFFTKTARSMAIERVSEMSERDLSRQISILASLFRDSARHCDNSLRQGNSPTRHDSQVLTSGPRNSRSTKDILTSVDQHFVAATNTFTTRTQSPAWLVVDVDGTGYSRCLRPVDLSLYGGLSGSLMYFAIRAIQAGTAETAVAVEQLSKQLLHGLRHPAEMFEIGAVGAFDGTIGVLYALNKTGRYSTSEQTREVFRGVFDGADWGRLLETEHCDIISGLAGIVCALTHLGENGVPQAEPIGRRAAGVLAERVLAKALGRSDREWGFAHGTLGIYYALTRSSKSIEDKYLQHALPLLRSRVRELISDGVFDKDPSWCRGMAGVLCCHREVELFEIYDATRIAGIVENLVESTADLSVCCGVAGLSSALALAGAAVSGDRRIRHSLVSCQKSCAESIGRVAGNPPALDQLGLMRGIVGSALSITETGRQILARVLRLN